MVVDSSIWIEIFSDGPHCRRCESELAKHELIRVPALVIFEVYRKLRQHVSEEEALEVTAFLRKHEVLDLNCEVALAAADLSLQYKLPMADSIVLAHATALSDQLLTLDNDFSGIPEAKVIR